MHWSGFKGGDFNSNTLNPLMSRKIESLCTQFSLHQAINQPTHFTEHSSSLIDILLVSNKDHLLLMELVIHS